MLSSDQYFIGDGRHTNLVLEKARNDQETFQIVPRGVPFLSILTADLLYFGLGVSVYFSDDIFTPPLPRSYKHLLFAGMVLVATIYTLASYFSFASEGKKGSWLIWNKQDKTVELPREGRTLTLSEIEGVVVAKGKISAGRSAKQTVYELHLIVKEEAGSIKLLNSNYPFKKVVEGLKTNTLLVVQQD